ncbi:D-tyrosyl-tRNA(Tyr) deacylase [bacterium]|nr:D-tyrosyl-tRNA(Tyr) deacylase [bacterium]
MRVVVQRVTQAAVRVDGEIVGQIGRGLLALVGFRPGDGEAELDWMAAKLVGLRLFEDADDKMNLSVEDVDGELLLVPQFTLYGDCRKGRRPGFSDALAPDQATVLFDRFCDLCARSGPPVGRGVFGAHMQVSLVNDGPVTLIIDRDQGSATRD